MWGRFIAFAFVVLLALPISAADKLQLNSATKEQLVALGLRPTTAAHSVAVAPSGRCASCSTRASRAGWAMARITAGSRIVLVTLSRKPRRTRPA